MKLLTSFIIFFSIILLGANTASAAPGPLADIENIFGNTSVTGRVVQTILLVSILALAPSILIMTTSFIRISIVLSLVRTAIGLQQTPPNQIIVSLALFLTFFIMTPAMEESYEKGLRPMLEERISEEEAVGYIIAPFKKFMVTNTRAKDLDLFTSIAKVEVPEDLTLLPIHVIIPSFMISELRRGFEIGFLIFLPFLIIDIVVSSVLMAMGMMMMPPIMVALPFKVFFFVLIDGWYLLSGSLIQSFAS